MVCSFAGLTVVQAVWFACRCVLVRACVYVARARGVLLRWRIPVGTRPTKKLVGALRTRAPCTLACTWMRARRVVRRYAM